MFRNRTILICHLYNALPWQKKFKIYNSKKNYKMLNMCLPLRNSVEEKKVKIILRYRQNELIKRI